MEASEDDPDELYDPDEMSVSPWSMETNIIIVACSVALIGTAVILIVAVL